ncbi:ABC transporter substrate-binding protein [Cerasicoccus maritimus]|uniref:ABC transporter substrate-binding protein n=1 Tax=Cerasicoccus maritimus TaxID=490089 RepID=UPI0028529A34|nr:ABC transporter substrate-binding protein [Cerasicoccus maritimus]
MYSSSPGSKLAAAAKVFGLFAGVAVLFALLLTFLNWALSPTIHAEKIAIAPELEAKMIALRTESFDIDPDNPPRNQVEVDYAEGERASWWPKGQSKVLDPAVENGDLPPVAERVGPEPIVLTGPDGVGQYGGTWMRLGTNSDWDIMSWRLSGANLVRWSPMGYPIVPHIAKSWTTNEEQTEWTLNLRKGIRWSDGHPVTTKDVMFFWNDVELGLDDGIVPGWISPGGVPPKVEAIDDYAFKITFAEPYGAFLDILASNIFYKFMEPEHYLRQFHPKIGNPEKIEEVRKKMGLASDRAVWDIVRKVTNPELPTLNPWIARSEQGTPPLYFVRNPYYYVVDTEGNQLPYIDQVMFEVKHPQLIPVAASAGSATMQGRNLSFDNYTLLMEGTENGGYELYHWLNPSRSVWTIFPNINRAAFDNDPASATKAKLLADKRFRQALSLAIDRQTIIDSVYHGIGEPSQLEPGKESPYHSEKLSQSYIEYNPERANQLLDELGLTNRGDDGMRTAPDGTPLTFYMDFTSYTGEGPAQFVVDDWRDIGIRAIQRERNRGLWGQERMALKQDMTIWASESEFIPLLEIRNFVANWGWSLHAPAYGTWYDKGGMLGKEITSGFAQEPPVGSPIRLAQEYWAEMLHAHTQEERVELFSHIADLAAEEVWTISIATPPPFLMVVDKDLRNVPEKALYGAPYNSPANTGIETYFFENQKENPAITKQIAAVMAAPLASKFTLDGQTGREPNSSVTEKLSKLVPWLWTICLLGFLIMMATKHPYVARRLIIMVPTLAIVSVIVFTVIQLPPGNFVETKIIQLQMNGDANATEQVERLTEVFNLDDPTWKQYLKWSGLKWFTSLDAGDKGLLQGELGISMQTMRSVNDTVEERALLTMAISLLTVLFTWAVAVPIGIYTAVKQYSIGDYLLTFIGFIGMCVPNFLLAILMMYWANTYFGLNVTGLFSPEYATDPNWSWGKIQDLGLHLIVPIVVIGTAGTASMIRVMRANLLDELRKPYVTTAMAKGVRPFKLLIKYPVRLAINPFISGIGHLFPSLLSGGSITAIILALPMIGPLLLDGLLTEDFYLAGSLLMVFSLLGIAGTLVSDIMLLLVDPRIRMDGGSK